MVKDCAECSKEFRTYPSKLKLGRGKYCSKDCSDKNTLIKKGQTLSPENKFKKGQKAHNYIGSRLTIARSGGKPYKLIYAPEHPHATKAGYVREHRLVMEEHLGRLLELHEIVHHKDSDTLNNDISNLEVMSKVEHDKMNVALNIHRRWYA